MKIIIADDERLVRVSIRSMLSELPLPIEIVGEASNGEELVALAAQYLPDAAFVDIKMPKLNGLEGIKAAKAVSPHTQWVVLTGYSEFSYAQEAVRLQAVNYLLKPVSPEQLAQVLQSLLQLQQKWDLTANKEFECDIISLIHGLSSITNGDALDISEVHYEAIIFVIDSCLNEQELTPRQFQFCRRIREVMNSMAAKEVRLALLTFPDGDLGTVCAWDSLVSANGRKIKESYFSQIEQLAECMNCQELSITIFSSGEYTKIAEFLAGLSGFSKLKRLRALFGTGRKYLRQDLESLSDGKNLAEICKRLVELAKSHHEGNYSAYIENVHAIQKWETQMGSVLSKYQAAWQRFIGITIGIQLPEKNQKGMYTQLEEYGESILKRQVEKRQSETDLVERAVAYVAQNYQYDIGISQIAEKFNVTPNYLSMLFHKKTGQAFMKYLTEIRMIKAKELLADPNLQIQEIAQEVGYYSPRHFTKVFTQFFGCYPSEYRKRLKA
jgi:two-component system, response regulator YesN